MNNVLFFEMKIYDDAITSINMGPGEGESPFFKSFVRPVVVCL